MPWPKGKPFPPAVVAKRVDSFVAGGKKRKKPQVINGAEHWRCATCDRWLTADAFHDDRRTPNGLKAQCRKCHGATNVRTRDPEKHRAAKVASEATRRARKAGQGGRVTVADMKRLRELLGTECLRCDSGVSIQWDHIVPLAHGGLHHPTNLQPLCRPCNETKQARFVDHRTQQQRDDVASVWVVEFRRIDALPRGTEGR